MAIRWLSTPEHLTNQLGEGAQSVAIRWWTAGALARWSTSGNMVNCRLRDMLPLNEHVVVVPKMRLKNYKDSQSTSLFSFGHAVPVCASGTPSTPASHSGHLKAQHSSDSSPEHRSQLQ